ncbi:MAG: PKD domain-containing protein [archaeon]|nr:PKD domain-containing protein [archaeon]
MENRIKSLIIGIIIVCLLLSSAYAATRTFRVQETEFVTLFPQAIDPDNDQVKYHFSKPLDNNGEWQTDYGDAGEYRVEITATDGVSNTTEEVLLIIEPKNKPPQLVKSKVQGQETEIIDVSNVFSDDEGNVLRLSYEKPFDKKGKWETSYEDEGVYITKVTANDGEFSTTGLVEITILPKNQPPIVVNDFSTSTEMEYNEGQTLEFFAELSDKENEPITKVWLFDGNEISKEEKGKKYFDYESEGKHYLRLIVSDGTSTIEKEWIINVMNTNRAPVIEHLPISVYEGETAVLELPAVDEDGDFLTYEFGQPFNESSWQTTYDDAGTYQIKITASDGKTTSRITVEVTVIDVDRAPLIVSPKEVVLNEGEKREWTIITEDPDGDEVNISFSGLPEDIIYNQNEGLLTWQPTFDLIKRKGGVISNVLNMLRLEHYFLIKKSFPVTINSCGKDLCRTEIMNLVVRNVNRPPVLEKFPSLALNETEKVILAPEAFDPDGDIVTFSYSKPVNSKGEWLTTHQDDGEYNLTVTASDGKLTDTKDFKVLVNRVNQGPQISSLDRVIVQEGEEFYLTISANDPDEDNVVLTASNLPPGSSFANGAFHWTPSYDTVVNTTPTIFSKLISKSVYLTKRFSSEEKVHWIEFNAGDGKIQTIKPVEILIKNKNVPPVITFVNPEQKIQATTFQPVTFTVDAIDADQDELTYTWSFNAHEPKIHATKTLERTFTTPGNKQVSVTVSDGRDSETYVWNILVSQAENPLVLNNQEGFAVYLLEG